MDDPSLSVACSYQNEVPPRAGTVTVGDKEHEDAIRRWLLQSKTSKPSRRPTRRAVEQQQRDREALAEAAFALDATPMELLVREHDPYSTVVAVKDLALSWESTGLTPQEVARGGRPTDHVALSTSLARLLAPPDRCRACRRGGPARAHRRGAPEHVPAALGCCWDHVGG